MMKIAFVGLRHGHVFKLANLALNNPETEISGVWEENAEALEAAKARIPADIHVYSSYDEILNDPTVEAVAVGDYYGIRGQRIIAALRAGKHVITDKPVCTRMEELDEIVKLCEEKNLRLGCLLDLRCDPAIRLARDVIRGGQLGEIRALAFSGQHALNWATRERWYFEEGKHGGTFNDIAIHGVDAVEMITGRPISEILCARQWNSYAVHAPDFADCAQFMGKLDNGAGVMADVSYSSPEPAEFKLPYYWRFSFWGEHGWLECRYRGGGADIALTGDPEARRIEAPTVADDALTHFLMDIRGEETPFGTQSVINSTRVALGLQRTADESM